MSRDALMTDVLTFLHSHVAHREVDALHHEMGDEWDEWASRLGRRLDDPCVKDAMLIVYEFLFSLIEGEEVEGGDRSAQPVSSTLRAALATLLVGVFYDEYRAWRRDSA